MRRFPTNERGSGKLAFGIVLTLFLASAAPASGQNFSPWSQAVPVGSLNTAYNDGCPFISKNGLSLYFRSNRPGGYGLHDIYVSHRDSADDPWEEPVNLGSQINTAADETCSFVSVDGHWLYFVSTRTDPPSCGGYDLWVSHRKDKRDDTGWETPVNLGCVVNSAAGDWTPWLFEDEGTGQTVLYFSSPRTGNDEIYASQMISEDRTNFGPPTPVVELNSSATDQFPSVRRRDGLEVIFVSNRAGGSGGNDLWVSTRAATSAPWSPPENLGSLMNSPYSEGRPSLSWDGTALYFFSNRPGGKGGLDLYVATRSKLPD